MNDNDLLLAIQELLDGVEWTPDTLNEICVLLNDNGYTIRDTKENTPWTGRRRKVDINRALVEAAREAQKLNNE